MAAGGLPGAAALRLLVLLPLATTLQPSAASAQGGKRDISGIAPGMTADQIVGKAQVTCRTNRSGNVSCVDPHDGSELKVLLSGGKPSLAISVKHTFCSSAPPASVLAGILQGYGVRKGASHSSPNGATFDIAGNLEGILNTTGGACPDGRRSYQFMISDNGSAMQGSPTTTGVTGLPAARP